MIAALLVALVLQTPGVPMGEDAAAVELQQVCKAVLCRAPTPVRLKLPDGTTFAATPSLPTPIVSGDYITVMPGEKVFVEAEAKDGALKNLVAVRRLAHPERTLVFDFKQEPIVKDGTDMILEVQSPFPGILKYRLGMMLVTDERPRRTSSCPLAQGKPVFEHWPHPIFQLVAGAFRFVDPSVEGAARCE